MVCVLVMVTVLVVVELAVTEVCVPVLVRVEVSVLPRIDEAYPPQTTSYHSDPMVNVAFPV